jgi:hypothetical protein
MEFGRSPIYSLLLLACAPLELVAAAFDRGGTIDFWARRPGSATSLDSARE